MHRGLEVRPSQGLEVWRVDVASRARNGAIVCRHKGLEVCGRGDVEAKSSYCESNACRSPEESIPFPSAQQLRMGSFLGRPLRYFVSRREWADGSSGRGGTRVQACAGVGKGSWARRASAARH